MIDVEFSDPNHLTAGWVGRPGERTFLVQAGDERELVTLVCEKGQVRGLADLLVQLLARVDDLPATDWDREAMQLRDPVEPRWRVGELSVGIDPERGRFLVEFAELVAADDREPRELRVWADQDQARRLAAHAAEQVDQGRPTCQFCGRPSDPDGGHVCPATNGHGRLSR